MRIAALLMVFGLLPVSLTAMMPVARADACARVAVSEFGGSMPLPKGELRRPEVHLTEPGRQCLGQDLHQRKLIDARTGLEMKTIGGDALVLIGADDVSLDLGGHTLSNERELGYTLIKHYRYEPGRGHAHRFVKSHIHNGSLVSPGSRGIGLRLEATGRYVSPGLDVPASVPQGKISAEPFADTRHQIEDLSIQAGLRAILIDGQNNVIRNNRIRVDGTTAIVAQGPGVIIENNLIEVKADLRMLSEHDRRREQKTPFAIRLVQADGAVIRNNEVRLIDGAGGKSLPAAVELVESRDVLIEANRLSGMQAAVRADAVSSYREIDNRLRVCPSGETRILPPEERGEVLHARPPACRSTGGR